MKYQKPSVHVSIWKQTYFRWLLVVAFVALLGVGIARADQGHENFLRIFLIGSVITFVVWRVIDVRRAKRQADQIYEQEENSGETELKRNKMLDTARHLYAKAPTGRWRITLGVRHAMGGATISEKRRIEFNTDGTGLYEGYSVVGLEIPIHAVFRYKPGIQPQRLLVQLIEPRLKDWHEVTFDFDLRTDDFGKQNLLMWFDGLNPLPSPLEELWPFQGEFLREDQ